LLEAVGSTGCCLSGADTLGHLLWVEKAHRKESFCIPVLFVWEKFHPAAHSKKSVNSGITGEAWFSTAALLETNQDSLGAYTVFSVVCV